jgi:hypothetical protein
LKTSLSLVFDRKFQYAAWGTITAEYAKSLTVKAYRRIFELLSRFWRKLHQRAQGKKPLN